MREEWKAEIVKRLFMHEISREELAKEADMTPAYLNMILAGKRNPASAEETITSALDRMIQRKERAT